MADEVTATEETTEQTPSTISSEETTTETDSQQETATPTEGQEDAFDAATLEADYGLPAGTLADAKDEESALEMIRQHTDSVLSAGLTAPQSTGQATEQVMGQEAPKQEGRTPSPGQKAPGGNAELDALRAELQEVKSTIQKQQQAQQQEVSQMLQQRAIAEVDNWKSPKYGTSESRTFNQLKALRELDELVNTHLAGCRAQGKQTPNIERVLRQVRAFHDDVKPAKKAESKPLGSSGASRQRLGNEEPGNIHTAMMSRFK